MKGNLTDIVKDLLYPPRCAVCDDILAAGEECICASCAKKTVYIKEPVCLKCGKSIKGDEEYCEDCQKRPHVFVQGKAVFDYGSISDSLARFKYKGRTEYAKFYAREIVRQRGDFIRAVSPDAFVPVPIHVLKLMQRGYNQSEIISSELSYLTKIPTKTDLIIRSKRTDPLKNLSARERQKNLKNAFKIGENDVKLKTIVIIDDIYTTGSTIDEMASVLKSYFDVDVYFITVTIGRGV